MIKQQFKNKMLSRTIVKNNILRIWELTDEDDRLDWYESARQLASDITVDYNMQYNCRYHNKTQITISQVIGVLAAFSPRKSWESNKELAYDLVWFDKANHMKVFNKKARDIMLSDGSDNEILSILNGNKITSFYQNIKYPQSSDYLTIDRHALSIALGYWTSEDDYTGMTTNQYNFFVHCYVNAAKIAGVTPLIMQSSTWVVWRKIKHNYKLK